jgi:hypothetical protein
MTNSNYQCHFMKKISFIILSILFFVSTISYAQKRKDKARANIDMLKNGALFVRLKTSELKISALKKNGQEKEAEKIRIDQENTNKSIIAAFKKNFTFCPVYFFYSNNSTQVKEGNYKGLLFDANNSTDINFSGSNYLIGEYDESKGTELNAFYIEDKNYDLLRPPFPYLIKHNQMLVASKSDDEMVILLNKKLTEFYE